MSKVNVPLLRKAVEWAEAEEAKKDPPRSEWHQGGWKASPHAHAMLLAEKRAIGPLGVDIPKWRRITKELEPECGTSYCIAGYVALVVNDLKFDPIEWHADNGYGPHISEVAADLLGIDPPRCTSRPEEGHLFHAGNTIQDVRRIAEKLAGERL